MNGVIVGYCPYCGGTGLLRPAHEQNSSDLIFVCDECLSVFESMEDLKNRKCRALKSRYEELTMEQAMQSGLGEYLMRFDGNRWVSCMGDEEPVLQNFPAEKSTSHLRDLETIRKYLFELVPRVDVVDAILKNFEKHEDLASEFAFCVRYGQAPEEQVTVCIGEDKFTAYSLMRDHKRIATLWDAYSFLAFLRDDPHAALDMLKRRLPIKD